jgi:uncharacterized membrane protein YkvA (DUF1232 family)
MEGKMFDDELDEEVGEEMSALSPSLSSDRAERFYDRLRQRARGYLDDKGSVAGKTAEYLLLVPDIFILLWRLVNDSRVTAKNKVMLGSGLAYYLFPLDIIPDFIGIGFLDDLVFAVYLLNKMLTDTDPAILREHWSGKEDLLKTIQKVLNSADTLVGKDVLGKLKKGI